MDMTRNTIKNDRQFRIGGGQGHYEVIDFLKGFSITTIVVMHLLQAFVTQTPALISKAASIGGTGVHVFIFCSGFGSYLSYLKKPKGYFEFLKSRFWKLYIPYIVVVLMSFFVPVLYGYKDRFMALLSHIFLFKMFFERYEGSFGDHLWFMSTIIQFYLLFIPLCGLKKKLKKGFLSIMTGISVGYWIIVLLLGKQELRIWNSFFLQYLWEFCLGMVMAENLARRKELRISRGVLLCMAGIGIGLQAVFAFQGSALKVLNDIPSLIGYGSLALLIYSLRFINKPILFVSGFSYEWYLLHILIFTLAFQLGKSDSLRGQLLLGVIALIMSVAAAWGYAKMIQSVRRIQKA